MIDWLNQSITFAGIATTVLEILGFLTGAICVYLNTRQNVLGWFFGIINAILYVIVFWQVKLYADMSLQGYYFFTSIMAGGCGYTAVKVMMEFRSVIRRRNSM